MPDINWYPGHMAKSRRLLIGQLKGIDAVVELCDARAPSATRNPDLIALCQGKAHVLVLNKADLADESATQKWIAHYKNSDVQAIAFNASTGKTRDILRVLEAATRPAVERMKARGANKTVRMMVIGIPNVGKSTFINRLNGANIVRAADRPGVTRVSQWVKVGPYLELLDTPGMLWPKLGNQHSARTLAFLGSIRDQIMDSEELSALLLKRLMEIAPEKAVMRFKMGDVTQETPPHELLEAACLGRGWLMSGKRADTERAAALVLDEFRAGKVGRITLESVR